MTPMARKPRLDAMLTKAQKKWIRETSAILDEMERNPPSKESLAPFRTRNWIRKGEGMLRGLKPIAVILLFVFVGGCAAWDEYVRLVTAPYRGVPYSVTWDAETGRSIRTYHYGQRDPLGSVHQYRPDIYHGFYGPHGARP